MIPEHVLFLGILEFEVKPVLKAVRSHLDVYLWVLRDHVVLWICKAKGVVSY